MEKNGLLFDFFDHERLPTLIDEALSNSTESQKLRDEARKKIINSFELKTVCIPKMLQKLV
jgi:hypothetical protein